MPQQVEHVYSCSTVDIIVPENRVRQEFNKKELARLAESIKSKGLLQPGVCRETPEGYELVAGERRLRACELAGKPYKFTLHGETDALKLLEIELEENVCRQNLSFQEEAEGMERLHNLLQAQSREKFVGTQTHGIRETAAYLNKSPMTVSDDLLIAKFLDVKEVREAPNKSEAKKVIKRIAEQYERAEAFKKAEAAEVSEIDEEDEVSEEQLLLLRAKKLSEKILCGEMEKILPTISEEFDIIIFDPPWGEGLDKSSSPTGSKKNYKDGEEEFLLLKDRLELLYGKMKKDSHLYLFFGIRRHQEVFDILESVGFETNRIPIIWHKIGAHRTRNADVWPGRAYEPIAYARKGKKILVKKGAPDVISARPVFGKAAGHHRSPKSPEVFRELLIRSALPGEIALDPMCGSGPLGVAAETMEVTHKLRWLMIDKDKSFVDLALQNVLRGYSEIMLSRDKDEDREEGEEE